MNKAEFFGRVKAVQGELVIRCEKLTVNYSQKESADSGGSEIVKMIFSGSVSIEQKTRKGHCQQAEYFRPQGRIVCTGNPWVMEGKNRIDGQQIVYWLNRDEIQVSQPRVNIQIPQDKSKGGSRP